MRNVSERRGTSQRGGKRSARVTLARLISKFGAASRSKARLLIEEGRVTVNGRPQANPDAWVDPVRDVVSLDGSSLKPKSFRYLAFNKPPDIVVSRSDERGRKTVFDVIGAEADGLMAVGRLDKESSGLLLLTNDHRMADRLLSPDSHAQKKYRIETKSAIAATVVEKLERGVSIRLGGEEYVTQPAEVRKVSPTVVEMILTEGKNRQIRRMMDSVGSEVVGLVRIAFGPIELRDLKEGEWRALTATEVENLRKIVSPRKQRA